MKYLFKLLARRVCFARLTSKRVATILLPSVDFERNQNVNVNIIYTTCTAGINYYYNININIIRDRNCSTQPMTRT